MVRGLTFHLLQNKRQLLDRLHGIIIDLIVHGSVMVCLDIWLETLKSIIPLLFWINPQLHTQPFQKFTREIMRLSHGLAMGSTEKPLELGQKYTAWVWSWI